MNLQSLQDWIQIIGLLVVGGFAVYGSFYRGRKDLDKEQNQAEDRVINLLKEQVDALEGKVKTQETDLHALTVKLEKALTENQILREVLQGRDKETKEFYAKGMVAINRSEELYAMSKMTNEAMVKLTGLIERHLSAIEEKFIDEPNN